MADTRQRLIDGAIKTIRQHGITGSSARTIANAASVNQALVFHHLGRRLHTEERSLGNVMVLAQMLAGAQADPKLAKTTSAALHLWIGPIEQALNRLLADSPLVS